MLTALLYALAAVAGMPGTIAGWPFLGGSPLRSGPAGDLVALGLLPAAVAAGLASLSRSLHGRERSGARPRTRSVCSPGRSSSRGRVS